jgi:hypothetical protein
LGQAELVLFHTPSGTLISADLFYSTGTVRPAAFDRPTHVPLDAEEALSARYCIAYEALFNVVFFESTLALRPEVPSPRLPLYRCVGLIYLSI